MPKVREVKLLPPQFSGLSTIKKIELLESIDTNQKSRGKRIILEYLKKGYYLETNNRVFFYAVVKEYQTGKKTSAGKIINRYKRFMRYLREIFPERLTKPVKKKIKK